MTTPTKLIDFESIYKPHPNQLLIHQAPYRHRVVDAGRRFGKSALALNEGLVWIMDEEKPRQMVWIILPEYKQAKNIYWIDPDITKYFEPYVALGLLKKNDNELSLYCPKTQSWMFLKGSDNYDSLRGSGLDFIIWDEVSDVKPRAFQTMSPTLIDSPNHRCLYIGTPDGYDYFHELCLMGDHKGIVEKGGKNIEPDPEYITFKFTSYDNLTWAEGTTEREAFVRNIDKEREKYKRNGQEDWFEQEYMGEFRKKAGAVHKAFSRETHLIENFVVPSEWQRIRGWDFGSNHPTASIRLAIDKDDNWFVELCYKERNEYIEMHAERVKEQDQDLGEIVAGVGDPSGRQWIIELNKYNTNIRSAKKEANTSEKNWLQLAIDKINEKMQPKPGHIVFLPNGRRIDNAPSFFILNRPENQPLLSELETLEYKQTQDGLTKAEIDDTKDTQGHYDLHACLRYIAVSSAQAVSYAVLDKPMEGVEVSQPQAKSQWDIRDEEQRKQLELQADLELMKANRRTW